MYVRKILRFKVHSFEGISNRQSGVRECYHLSVLPVVRLTAGAGALTEKMTGAAFTGAVGGVRLQQGWRLQQG